MQYYVIIYNELKGYEKKERTFIYTIDFCHVVVNYFKTL